MITPDLNSIFFSNDFTDDMIPELAEARQKASIELDKLAKKHNLSFDERDEIECATTNEAVMSQYMGFVQGFKWAVYLFTGHKDEEAAPLASVKQKGAEQSA